MHARPPHEIDELERRLRGWVLEGLISEETARAISRLERERRTRSASTPPPPRGVPILTEVAGYLGAALAGAAAAVFLARAWDDLGRAGRLLVPGLGMVVFLVAGLAIARRDETAVQRLAGLLLFLSVAAAAWLAALVTSDVAGASDRSTVVAVGATLTTFGGALYGTRRWPLQQLAVLSGLAVLLGGALFGEEPALPRAIGWTLLGGAWAFLGARGMLEPQPAAIVIGALLSVFGPMTAMGEWTGAAMLLGVAAAAYVVTLGALRHEGIVLGIGVVAAFMYLVRSITYYLRGSIAVALGLLVVGIGLMTLAVIVLRTRPRPGPQRTRPGPPRAAPG